MGCFSVAQVQSNLAANRSSVALQQGFRQQDSRPNGTSLKHVRCCLLDARIGRLRGKSVPCVPRAVGGSSEQSGTRWQEGSLQMGMAGQEESKKVKVAGLATGVLAAALLMSSQLCMAPVAWAERSDPDAWAEHSIVGRTDFPSRIQRDSEVWRPGNTFDDDDIPWWGKIGGLVLLNYLGLRVVLAGLTKLGDDSEPISVVKIQLGLVKDHDQVQNKLAEFSSMIKNGRQGQWLVLEQAILEMSSHRDACGYASVQKATLKSKEKAFSMFAELTAQEEDRASREEGYSLRGDAEECRVGGGGFFGGFFASPPKETCAPEVCVITLLVTTKGELDIPQSAGSWQEVRHCMQQLCGRSSKEIMAVELLWTPQREGDFLTAEQLLSDYPDLKPVKV